MVKDLFFKQSMSPNCYALSYCYVCDYLSNFRKNALRFFDNYFVKIRGHQKRFPLIVTCPLIFTFPLIVTFCFITNCNNYGYNNPGLTSLHRAFFRRRRLIYSNNFLR